MLTVRAAALPAFGSIGTTEMTAVATVLIVVAGGAVNAKVARPSLSLTTSLSDTVPTFDEMRSRWAGTGRLDTSRTVTVITDCELPSRGNRSGVAVIVTDRANSEGPVNTGAGCSWTEQPASPLLKAANIGAAISLRRQARIHMILRS